MGHLRMGVGTDDAADAADGEEEVGEEVPVADEVPLTHDRPLGPRVLPHLAGR